MSRIVKSSRTFVLKLWWISYYTLVTVPGPAHLNWRLLVPRSLDSSPTLSTLELLSSLMLWPVFRLLVLLHRRFQD